MIEYLKQAIFLIKIGGKDENNIIRTELNVINNKVSVMRVDNVDYISLTDLAKYKDKDRTDYIIQNWMRNTNSILFLGT